MLGGNLGSLLYGDSSVMGKLFEDDKSMFLTGYPRSEKKSGGKYFFKVRVFQGICN